MNWDNVQIGGLTATYATGEQSSANVYASGSDTAGQGVRILRGYPTVAALSVPSTSLADASQKVLYRFSVSAPAGTNGVSLYKFMFNVATTGDDDHGGGLTGYNFQISNLRLFAFTGSNFSGGAFSSDGQLNNGTTLAAADGNNDAVGQIKATTTDYAIYFNPVNNTSAVPEAVAIPAGQTYYFELRGDVSGADTGDVATIQLVGDSAWYGIGNTTNDALAPSAMAYDDAGFLPGAINYGFATTAPFVDASPHTGGGTGAVAGALHAAAPATGGHVDGAGPGNALIWSGNSTTTHSGASGTGGADWYNGFAVPGLPQSGAGSVTFTL